MKSSIIAVLFTALVGCAGSQPEVSNAQHHPDPAARLRPGTVYFDVQAQPRRADAVRPVAPRMLHAKSEAQRQTMTGPTPWGDLTRPRVPSAHEPQPAKPVAEPVRYISDL